MHMLQELQKPDSPEDSPSQEEGCSEGTYSDAACREALGECQDLIKPPGPTTAFKAKEPSWKEIQTTIRATRSSSAPGINGVPYLVNNKCPKLMCRLWKILRVIWRRRKVAQQWRYAKGVWIPKEENSTIIKQFRTTSLLNVEGKIFFSILAQ